MIRTAKKSKRPEEKYDWDDYINAVVAASNKTLEAGDEQWTYEKCVKWFEANWSEKNWKKKKKKGAKGGGYAMMPGRMTQEQQLQWLQNERASGSVRTNSPDLVVVVKTINMSALKSDVKIMSYATDEASFPPAQSVMCFDALQLSAASMEAGQLGLRVLPPTANKYANFIDLNKRWSSCEGLGSLFIWTKMDTTWTLSDIFLSDEGAQAASRPAPLITSLISSVSPHTGVFGISCELFHHEDVDHSDAEGVPHYVSFNAGTGLLHLYPDVMIVLQEDRDNLGVFFRRLAAPPFCLKFATSRSANRSARRLSFICSDPLCLQLPLAPSLRKQIPAGGMPLATP